MKPEAHVPVGEYAQDHPVLKLPGETRLLDHLPQLDGIRAVAVGLVIWSHFMPRDYSFRGSPPWGAIGVAMFFTLSGFLITRILLNARAKVDDRDISAHWNWLLIAPFGLMLLWYNDALLAAKETSAGLRGLETLLKLITYVLLARVGVNIAGNVWRCFRKLGQLLKQFYIRRFLRIFPLYYAVLAGLTILNTTDIRDRIWYSLLYFTNYRMSYDAPIYIERWVRRIFFDQKQAYLNTIHWDPAMTMAERHLWSLSVEEQFYIFWPFIILLCPRKMLLPVMMLMVAIAPVWRIETYTRLLQAHEWMTPGCLDLLCMGGILALLSVPLYNLTRYREGFVQICGLIGVPAAIAFVAQRWYPSVIAKGVPTGVSYDLLDYGGAVYPMTALLAVWLIGTAARGFRGPIGWFLTCAPVVYIGRISYGLYVLHMLMPSLMAWAFPDTFGAASRREWFHFIVLTALSVAAASISWFAFEAPINKLKRYFEYNKSDSAKAATPAVSA